MNASRVLWHAAGCPDPRKPVHTGMTGRCYWCGEALVGEGCRVKDVCGSSFTDQDCARAPLSPWMCPGCTWAMSGRPPDTLRLWSVIWVEGWAAPPSHPQAPHLGPEFHLQNKSEPSVFDALLRDPPSGRWVCAIADKGKIHVVPFAQVNQGKDAWVVRFERTDVRARPATYVRIADAMRRMYALGFSKDDIATGAPSAGRLARLGLDLWRREEETLGPHRGSALFALALFLLRKETANGDQ